MYYETEVIDCCGLRGFYDLPDTKEKFINSVGDLVQEYNSDNFNFDDEEDYEIVHGAFVLITTSSQQPIQEAYLKELGFNNVGTKRNSNSGNLVTVWLMSAVDFNSNILGV